MPKLAVDANSKGVQVLKPSTTSTLSVTTTSAATSAITGSTVVRLYSDAACFYAVGSTATTSSVPLSAGSAEYIRIDLGDTIAAITSSGSATLYVTLMV